MVGTTKQRNESDLKQTFKHINSRSITYQRETYYQPPTDTTENQHRTKQNISLSKRNNSDLKINPFPGTCHPNHP